MVGELLPVHELVAVDVDLPEQLVEEADDVRRLLPVPEPPLDADQLLEDDLHERVDREAVAALGKVRLELWEGGRRQRGADLGHGREEPHVLDPEPGEEVAHGLRDRELDLVTRLGPRLRDDALDVERREARRRRACGGRGASGTPRSGASGPFGSRARPTPPTRVAGPSAPGTFFGGGPERDVASREARVTVKRTTKLASLSMSSVGSGSGRPFSESVAEGGLSRGASSLSDDEKRGFTAIRVRSFHGTLTVSAGCDDSTKTRCLMVTSSDSSRTSPNVPVNCDAVRAHAWTRPWNRRVSMKICSLLRIFEAFGRGGGRGVGRTAQVRIVVASSAETVSPPCETARSLETGLLKSTVSRTRPWLSSRRQHRSRSATAPPDDRHVICYETRRRVRKGKGAGAGRSAP